MACPHVAGVTALLLSINPDMNFEQVRSALIAGVDNDLPSDSKSCGDIAGKSSIIFLLT